MDLVAYLAFPSVVAAHPNSADGPAVQKRRLAVIDATIQKGPTGFVPIGRGEGTPACFVGYAFRLNGSTYTGLFALYGNRDDVERVRKNFSSGSIRVRYNPANPSVSYLNELNDSRFGRLSADSESSTFGAGSAF